MTSCTSRAPRADETCSCGRSAIVVYVVTDEWGDAKDVPWCGIPDGGKKTG